MIHKKKFSKCYKAKIFDDSGLPLITINEKTPQKLKKKFNTIFNKFL